VTQFSRSDPDPVGAHQFHSSATRGTLPKLNVVGSIPKAWQPLKRVEITAEGHKARLVPLLPAPVKTTPESRPDGIADLDQIALTYPQPVDPAALSRLAARR
jgi:hypothetical protein